MAILLKGATVVELEPAHVEVTDLRVEPSEGRIVARGELEPQPGDEVIPLQGKVVMPGLVCGDHHLPRVLAQMVPGGTDGDYLAAIERRAKFDAALDLDTLEVASAMACLDALLAGTTTLLARHASPSSIEGSLGRIGRAVSTVGMRGVLGYEVSDAHGPALRDRALEENVGFARSARGRLRGRIAADASYVLAAETLRALGEAVSASGAALTLSLAEDPVDERLSRERYGSAPVERLLEAGLLTPKTLVAHAVHLSWPELAQVISTGAWIVHSARANMRWQVGYAPAGKFGARALFGTGDQAADLFAEARLAWLRSKDAGQPIQPLRALANGHRVASEIYDLPIGPMREGAAADLLVLDYRPAAPLTAETLEAHLLNGMGARWVDSVMVDGIWRVWRRTPLSVSADALTRMAQALTPALLERARSS
jgi:cytosine/adenosine deaminase-related metal-dependent hydrolase